MTDDELGEFLERGSVPAGATLPAGAERVRASLGSEPVWDQPPPDALDRVLARIDTERAAASAPTVRRTPTRRRLLAAAAAVVLVGAGATGGWIGAQQVAQSRGDRITLAGTELAPTASATGRIRDTASGVAISLDLTGLPPAAAGTFYEAWLKSPAGDLVPIGTFHVRRGNETVELWSGVDTMRYPTITVTVQREGAGPRSSGRVVLRGTIPPPR